jgi:hypothetical protein
VFTVGSGANVNFDGDTYVAYLFAHDAGGFGLSGTDNVISCGSYTGNGSTTGPVIDLGYEPQWVMVKNASGTGNWRILDNMRGMPVTGLGGGLEANTSAAEAEVNTPIPTATGFRFVTTNSNYNTNGSTYIYIAIRRGPMKVPTTGTSVFVPLATSGTYSSPVTLSTGFPVDSIFSKSRGLLAGYGYLPVDRLRGSSSGSTPYLNTPTTNAEVTNSAGFNIANNTGATDAGFWTGAPSGGISYLMFRRAPGFFDEVCFSGNGLTQNVTHNLGVAPELLIVKERGDDTGGWLTYFSGFGVGFYLQLQTTAARVATTSIDPWNNASPAMTSTTFSVGQYDDTNGSGDTYVAYLFATCPGVSKVGSYTGNGSSQTINCGFTGGARFVMIKRTDSTGNWMMVDTARGLVSAGDPTLYLNSTAAEVTGVDWLDPDSSGFIVNQESTMNANVSSASYIFLAIS